MSSSPVLPGATLGIIGSGQLGRMLASAARELGYRVHVYSPEPDSPAGQVADLEVLGSYADAEAVSRFAAGVDAATYEFENIPSATARAAAAQTLLRPAPELLHVTQQRLREKRWLAEQGFPLAGFREVDSAAELAAAAQTLGYPCVLKSSGFGYDGKGQFKLHSASDLGPAWQAAEDWEQAGDGLARTVLEQWVSFELECSVVGARGAGGEIELFPLAENIHSRHILDLSVVPARVDDTTALRAQALAHAVLKASGLIGVMAIELFLARDGQLLINELAPRVHNSGHWSIEGAVTSQFEQHVRAVCGLPLGSAEQQQPAAMANLLGELWFDSAGQPQEPDWAALLNYPEVKLHLYGKREARPGRKMGHLTALGEDSAAALARVCAARAALQRDGQSAC